MSECHYYIFTVHHEILQLAYAFVLYLRFKLVIADQIHKYECESLYCTSALMTPVYCSSGYTISCFQGSGPFQVAGFRTKCWFQKFHSLSGAQSYQDVLNEQHVDLSTKTIQCLPVWHFCQALFISCIMTLPVWASQFSFPKALILYVRSYIQGYWNIFIYSVIGTTSLGLIIFSFIFFIKILQWRGLIKSTSELSQR